MEGRYDAVEPWVIYLSFYSTIAPPFACALRWKNNGTENRISYKGNKMETAFKLQSWRLSLRVLFVC